MKLDKDRIKESLNEADIHKVLLDLGSEEPKKDREGNSIFTTVCHGGHSHKLYYYEQSKMFHCYSGCGSSMDIFELVIRSHSQNGIELTFYQAVQYVANITNKYFIDDGFMKQRKNYLVDDWDWINKFSQKKKIDVDIPIINECILDVLIMKPHELWLEEISYETQMKFEVGFYFKENRIITPHRNVHSKLIGLTGRALNQEDIDNGKKYMPITIENKLYSFPTIFNLYGLNHTKDAIRRLKKVAIFESQKSVMKCEDYYGEDNFSVATCSSNISNYHRDLLLELKIEEVFICFDKFRSIKENETKEVYQNRLIDYQENILKLAKKFTSYARVFIVWDFDGLLGAKDAPVDKGKDTLEVLMKNKIEITTNEVVDCQ